MAYQIFWFNGFLTIRRVHDKHFIPFPMKLKLHKEMNSLIKKNNKKQWKCRVNYSKRLYYPERTSGNSKCFAWGNRNGYWK